MIGIDGRFRLNLFNRFNTYDFRREIAERYTRPKDMKRVAETRAECRGVRRSFVLFHQEALLSALQVLPLGPRTC